MLGAVAEGRLRSGAYVGSVRVPLGMNGRANRCGQRGRSLQDKPKTAKARILCLGQKNRHPYIMSGGYGALGLGLGRFLLGGIAPLPVPGGCALTLRLGASGRCRLGSRSLLSIGRRPLLQVFAVGSRGLSALFLCDRLSGRRIRSGFFSAVAAGRFAGPAGLGTYGGAAHMS